MYYLADIFTLTEGILAIIIFALSFLHATPETIIFLFSAAELCDALDGPCARHWHYPNDGKRRWWREHCEWTDKGTDLLTGASLVFYITLCLNFQFGLFICLACTLVGVPIQLLVYECKSLGYNLQVKRPKLALSIICIRRFAYAVAIFIVLGYLILATHWMIATKFLLLHCLLIIGCILMLAKGRRLREW